MTPPRKQQFERAMILCAGDGKRLQPLTDSMPKPLIPIAGMSCLHRALKLLNDKGVRHIVVNARRHADQIVATVQQIQQDDNKTIDVSIEEDDLDSGGGVKRALSLLGSAPFCVLNGDSIWHDDGGDDTDAYACLCRGWRAETMDGLLLVVPCEKGSGDFAMTADGRLYGRNDKEQTTHRFIGMQILKPCLFNEQRENRFSLRAIYDAAAERGRLFAVVYGGLWLHLSAPVDIARMEARLKEL
ncbi:MAG: nucleotidyltransferase family protein [Alphaproteobacteria bacterium GM202ARS2]|nr:nucleotidyltransferase family protein [Alphaproteobacteria bacterium GM202ARS2]